MSSSHKMNIEIDHEIRKRINQESPSKYDIEFYKRKVRRIQTDYQTVQDELNKVRLQLRKAEDYEFKYELLFKQTNTLKSEALKAEKTISDLKAANEMLKTEIEIKNSKTQDFSKERLRFQQEIQRWKDAAQQAEQKRVREVAQQKDRADLAIKKEAEKLKKDFTEKEEDYQAQIRQLRKVIHEKETVESIVHSRVQKIRKEKDEEIDRLGSVIEQIKVNHQKNLAEKNEEVEKMKEKFERMLNFQLQNIKKNLDDQDQMFSIELNGLREMLGLKNDEISKLLIERKEVSSEYEQSRKELINEINILKEAIYKIERQNELELYNMQERLIILHAKDLEAMEKRYNETINGLKANRQDLERYIKQKEKEVESMKSQHEKDKEELADRIKERDGRIQQLQEKNKDTVELNTSEMKNLHQSFHNLESEKEVMGHDYRKNVDFLNTQIAKLNAQNDVKTKDIQKLTEELHEQKLHYEQELKDIDNRYRRERKDREEDQQKERLLREQLSENLAQKAREWKNIERKLIRERDREMREKNKSLHMIEELERDAERNSSYIKELDENLKNEFKKSQLGNLDGQSLRREIISELERQKVELEAIKRMEVDQIQKKYEVQVERLISQNEKLQTDLLNKSLSFENLEGQFKKLEHINKNIDKINRQKLIDYEKKIATLNSEINITQNLYEAFMQAKSRVAK